jgi:hypothetical protein
MLLQRERRLLQPRFGYHLLSIDNLKAIHSKRGLEKSFAQPHKKEETCQNSIFGHR